MSTDKPGSPPCGIYVRIDDFSNMLDAIGWVRKLAFTINRSSGYEKNMTVVELAHTPENEEKICDLIPVIQDNGLVAIVTDHFETADKADGILLNNVSDAQAAKEALGEDKIIGVVCKDKAAGEQAIAAKVDYAVLNADPALITWWSAQTDILSVARAKKGVTSSNCGTLVSAGAGFVDVGSYILNHKKDIMQGTVNILHAVEQAAEKPSVVN